MDRNSIIKAATESFSGDNLGSQVGWNMGSITNNFNQPPGRPSTPPPEPFASIPFFRDPDFIHRGDILDRIRIIISKPPQRVALTGLSGVGKSQLAIEFAYSVNIASPQSWIFWIHSGTSERVVDGFRTTAETVKLPGRHGCDGASIVPLVSRWLSSPASGRWMIILDSADDQSVFVNSDQGHDGQPLSTFLPQCQHGSFIITSRDRSLADELTGHRDNSIEIGPMSISQGLELLEKKLGNYKGWDQGLAKKLVQSLDFFPLAVGQAAAYLRAAEPMVSMQQYLDDFHHDEDKREKLLSHDGGDLQRTGALSNAVLTTWQMSFDHIRSRRPSAAQLLSLMSCFDRQGIPAWVLRAQCTPCVDEETTTDGEIEAGNPEDTFEADIIMLRNFSLLNPNERGDAFSIHGLVQFSTRKWLEASGQWTGVTQRFIHRIAAAFPSLSSPDDWKRCSDLFLHVIVASEYDPSTAEHRCWSSLLIRAIDSAFVLGYYSVGLRFKSSKLFMRPCGNTFGDLHNPALLSALKASEFHVRQGQWKDAEYWAVEALFICENQDGIVSLFVFRVIGILSEIYTNTGEVGACI